VAPPKPAGSASPQFGFLPTTITATDAVAAYDQWKTAYLESCPDSVFRVRSDEPELTVSEGIAYGMLLAAYHGDQTTFDGLWQYYLDNRDSKGLMHWRRSGCEGGASGDNAASDADIDAALALIKASCQWPNTGRHDYADDASTLLRTIQRVELSLAPGGGYYLKPGDSFGGADCINYSYFAPGYYRIFADYMSDSAAVWGSMPAVAYALINAGANAQTGLVPNWAELDGSTPPMGCDWYENPEIYGWDAVRTPWRVGMDYLWTGDAQAGAYLQKLSGWVDSIGGIGEVYAEHTLDGASRVPYRSNPATGGMAFAGVAVDQATSDAYFLYLKNNPTSGYFHESLRALYLLAAAGMMSHDCTGVVYP
jgi:endo-1,4-beta-D-glucanase Y